MRAFLLCAGLSSRFKVNKLLIKLNGENCVQRQVRLLKEQGVTDITVVVNPQTALDLLSSLPPNIQGLKMEGEHKNAFIELQNILPHIKEDDDCLIILGDVVCSKNTLSYMVKKEGDFNIYGLEHGNRALMIHATIWGRPEVFAIKIVRTHLKEIKELLSKLDPLYKNPQTGKGFYDWWNIPRRLHIPITPVGECLDIDYEGDVVIIKKWLKTVV